MELRTGYKRTEVGIIPEDWEVMRLGDVVDFANGKPHENQVIPLGPYCLITLDSIAIDGTLKAEHRMIGVLDHSLMKDDLVIILSDLNETD